MQSQTLANSTVANPHLSLTPNPDTPLTERQIAELREAWLEHQVNPLGDIQRHGVPESALHD